VARGLGALHGVRSALLVARTALANPTGACVTPAIDWRQWIKWVVYGLLLVNWALYIRDDWEIASHTMRNGGSLLDWSGAFATSIDELAWFVLLFLFELETYALADEALGGLRTRLLHGVRFLCYAFLAHTLYAYAVYIYELAVVAQIEGVSSLCEMVGADVSFARNLEYTVLDEINCASLSTDSRFFYVEEGLAVTDADGLSLERRLAWVDLAEAVTWLLILFTIEMSVRLQDRGITAGLLTSVNNRAKFLLYGLLWLAVVYWASLGHWLFAWDESLWILGFAAIEMNVAEWREEIEEQDAEYTHV
jgi:hypothetical protein